MRREHRASSTPAAGPRLPERPDEIRAALDGRLTQAVAFELRNTLASLASRRPRRLVLDLSAVSFLDASTVTSLRALERRITGAGGGLVLEAEGAVARTLDRLGAGHLLAPAPAVARASRGLRASAPAPA